MKPSAFQIFIAYSRKDTEYLDELRVHLRPLERTRQVKVWYDGKIEPGAVWEDSIKKHLHEANLILLLVSADAIASDYFYEKEVSDALERHGRGEARVVPLIVRPCDWTVTPLADLQALPKNGKPVTAWPDRDDAYADAARSLRMMVEKWEEEKKVEEEHKKKEAQFKAAEECRKQEAAVAAKKAIELKKAKKEEEAQETVEQQHLLEETNDRKLAEEEKRRKLEAERRKRQQAERERLAEAERQRKKAAYLRWEQQWAKIITGFRSPWMWGSVVVFFIVFIAVKFGTNGQNQPNTAVVESLPTGRKNGFEMMPVKGGTFIMGDANGDSDECPHQVTVGDFCIGKYEVTKTDWREVMGSDPSDFKDCDDCPVERVSWDDLQEFFKKANAKYGQKFRLPTEAEWEFAARGGQKLNDDKYSGGNNLSLVGWYRTNSNGKIHSVGTKNANEFGIHDMSGNVWEWCDDKYEPYPNCAGNKSDSRVLRGGGWGNDAPLCRSTHRRYFDPAATRRADLGFRLVSVL